jgi:hypothetical protein
MKNIKGELSTQQIILLIILIVSFVVILFLLLRLNLGGESDKELCHNSVVMRGNSVASDSTFPLKCTRSYVCITEDGDCGGLLKPEKHKVKTKEEIYDVLANEMADCWWMYGEGTLNYIGDGFTKENYCSICSQVLLHDSLNSIEGIQGKIDQDEFYNYLAVTEIEPGKTYAEYFFGTSDIEGLKRQILSSSENADAVGTFGNLDVGKDFFVITGITSEIGNTYKWIGAGVAVLALLTPVGWVATAVIIGGGTTVAAFGDDVAGLFEPQIGAITVDGKGVKNQFMVPTIVPAHPKSIEVLNCEDFEQLG